MKGRTANGSFLWRHPLDRGPKVQITRTAYNCRQMVIWPVSWISQAKGQRMLYHPRWFIGIVWMILISVISDRFKDITIDIIDIRKAIMYGQHFLNFLKFWNGLLLLCFPAVQYITLFTGYKSKVCLLLVSLLKKKETYYYVGSDQFIFNYSRRSRLGCAPDGSDHGRWYSADCQAWTSSDEKTPPCN